MKNIILILISLFLFNSCVKKDNHDYYVYDHWGTTSALKNGKDWNAEPFTTKRNSKLVIFFNTYSKEGYSREEIVISNIPVKVGEYRNIGREAENNINVVYATLVDDGDVFGAFYDVMDADAENMVAITKIKDKEIWGTYNLTVYLKTKNGLDTSDKLEFTQGKFHVKIHEE